MKNGPPPTIRESATVVCVLAMTLAFLWVGRRELAPTIDEPFHAVRGVALWWTGSARLSYAHPPLANALMALPSLLTTPPYDLTTVPGWRSGNHWKMVYWLAKTDYEPLRTWIYLGRSMGTPVMLALCLVVYRWTRRRAGPLAAMLALIFCAFNPSLLAHGQLLTTDLPIVLAYTFAVLTFADYLVPLQNDPQHPRRPLAWFAGAMAAALCTKFTALVLVPVFGGMGLVTAAMGWGRFAGSPVRARLREVFRDMAVVAGFCLLAVNALYGFNNTLLTPDQILSLHEPQNYLTKAADQMFLETHSVLPSLPRWARVPVPYTYLYGVHMVLVQTEGQLSWFMGETTHGDWRYFPVMLLIKTPWPVWLATLLVPVALWRRRGLEAGQWVVLVAATALMLVLLRSNLHLGVRHALPIVPLISVLAATGTAAVLESAPPRLGRGVVAAVGAWMAWVAAANAGFYLPWFNTGSQRGHAISVVGEDWGQDTLRLAKAWQEDHYDPLYLWEYGHTESPELRRLGIPVRETDCGMARPERGWIAAHRVHLARKPTCLPWLRGQPDRVVADHLYLYDLERLARQERE